MKFAEEFGIPRTTEQGYAKGISRPRADSPEGLASKLELSVAEPISGKEYSSPLQATPALTRSAQCCPRVISFLSKKRNTPLRDSRKATVPCPI